MPPDLMHCLIASYVAWPVMATVFTKLTVQVGNLSKDSLGVEKQKILSLKNSLLLCMCVYMLVCEGCILPRVHMSEDKLGCWSLLPTLFLGPLSCHLLLHCVFQVSVGGFFCLSPISCRKAGTPDMATSLAFSWCLGVEFGSLGFCGYCFYPLSHFSGSRNSS